MSEAKAQKPRAKSSADFDVKALLQVLRDHNMSPEEAKQELDYPIAYANRVLVKLVLPQDPEEELAFGLIPVKTFEALQKAPETRVGPKSKDQPMWVWQDILGWSETRPTRMYIIYHDDLRDLNVEEWNFPK